MSAFQSESSMHAAQAPTVISHAHGHVDHERPRHRAQLVNAQGESTFVKFHWRPELGIQSTVWDEALKLQAADDDYHRRDLCEAIEAGEHPAWELCVQLFSQEQADALPYDHLDPTKLIPEEEIPLRKIGRFVLDRWPDNFFAETEQVAFCPANLPPGIDFSNDPLLIDRMKPTLQGRCVAILVDEGSSAQRIAAFHQALVAQKASVKIIAPKIGGATLDDGSHLPADGQLAGSTSAQFDAVVSIITLERGEALAREAAAQDWFRNAFGHLKAIAACKATEHILQTAGITPDEGVFPIDTPEPFIEGAKKRFWDRQPTLRTLA